MKMRRIGSSLTLRATLAGLLLILAIPVAATTHTDHPEGAGHSSAIIVSATNAPVRVTGSDGQDHLAYDLIVTNVTFDPVAITEIEVFDGDDSLLFVLDGEALVTATQPILGAGPLAEIAASSTVAVVMDVTVPTGTAIAQLRHRIAYELAADAPSRPLIGTFEVHVPDLDVDPRPAVVLGAPLRGEGWLVANACCAPDSPHRLIRIAVDGLHFAKPEIFSIDWLQLEDGLLFAGDGSTPEQWYGFGEDILAVADGLVVSTRDDMPDELPGVVGQHVHSPEDYGGNHVTIEIAPGIHVFYGHLELGSVAVEVGDIVSASQVIGRLGNSGNTTAPHLHFGVIDANDPIVGGTLPLVFDQYTLAGNVDPVVYATANPLEPLPIVGPPVPQINTFPLYLAVVDFD